MHRRERVRVQYNTIIGHRRGIGASRSRKKKAAQEESTVVSNGRRGAPERETRAVGLNKDSTRRGGYVAFARVDSNRSRSTGTRRKPRNNAAAAKSPPRGKTSRLTVRTAGWSKGGGRRGLQNMEKARALDAARRARPAGLGVPRFRFLTAIHSSRGRRPRRGDEGRRGREKNRERIEVGGMRISRKMDRPAKSGDRRPGRFTRQNSMHLCGNNRAE